jgi:hypothetical protein
MCMWLRDLRVSTSPVEGGGWGAPRTPSRTRAAWLSQRYARVFLGSGTPYSGKYDSIGWYGESYMI